MLVVSNTSPLSYLAIIGRLDLLREQLGSVTIPPGVRTELSRHPNFGARSVLEKALADCWLSIVPLVAAVPTKFATALDLGEAEALALALETKADLVLLDESAEKVSANDNVIYSAAPDQAQAGRTEAARCGRVGEPNDHGFPSPSAGQSN